MHMCVFAQVSKGLEKAKEGAGAPEAEVTGNCEPHTRVLGVELGSCARAVCTELLSHLSGHQANLLKIDTKVFNTVQGKEGDPAALCSKLLRGLRPLAGLRVVVL